MPPSSPATTNNTRTRPPRRFIHIAWLLTIRLTTMRPTSPQLPEKPRCNTPGHDEETGGAHSQDIVSSSSSTMIPVPEALGEIFTLRSFQILIARPFVPQEQIESELSGEYLLFQLARLIWSLVRLAWLIHQARTHGAPFAFAIFTAYRVVLFFF